MLHLQAVPSRPPYWFSTPAECPCLCVWEAFSRSISISVAVPLCSLSELESWESLMEEFRGPEITHLITPPTPKKTRLEKKKADSKRRKRKRCLFSSVGSCWTTDQQWQADISMVTPRGALRYSDCCHQPSEVKPNTAWRLKCSYPVPESDGITHILKNQLDSKKDWQGWRTKQPL